MTAKQEFYQPVDPIPSDLVGWRRGAFSWGIALLRIGFGLVFLTNGLAKVGLEIPILPGYLIDYDGARNILTSNVKDHPVGLYQDLIENLVLDHYTPFGVALTMTEIAIGLMLVTGAFSSVGALIGAAFTLHINFSTLEDSWTSGPWAWEGAVEWVPLIALALIGAGRYHGLDSWVSRRLPTMLRRWPLSG